MGAKRAEIIHLDLDKNLIDIVYDPSITVNDHSVSSSTAAMSDKSVTSPSHSVPSSDGHTSKDVDDSGEDSESDHSTEEEE